MNKQPLPDPRAKQRLRWIHHYEQVTKKVAPTCRYFGITRGTFSLWYHRYLSLGVEGLRSNSCRPHKIQRWLPKEIRDTILSLRVQRRYGPHRMCWYLQQQFHWYVSKNTIWRLYKEHGLNRLKYKKRWQRYPQQYAKALPGDRVQLDVKFLDRIGREGKKYYQFTAIDDCTRFRVLRIYDHNTVKSAVDFIDQVKQVLPFVIKQVQTDNGGECPDTFSWHLEDLGIHHRKTRIRSPEENGKVERSHRTDEEEFYGVNRFVSIHHLTKLLAQWETEYNGQRPHMALGGKTPRAFLTEKLKTHYSKQLLTVPVKTVQDVG